MGKRRSCSSGARGGMRGAEGGWCLSGSGGREASEEFFRESFGFFGAIIERDTAVGIAGKEQMRPAAHDGVDTLQAGEMAEDILGNGSGITVDVGPGWRGLDGQNAAHFLGHGLEEGGVIPFQDIPAVDAATEGPPEHHARRSTLGKDQGTPLDPEHITSLGLRGDIAEALGQLRGIHLTVG
jgi:hypothetical protein